MNPFEAIITAIDRLSDCIRPHNMRHQWQPRILPNWQHIIVIKGGSRKFHKPKMASLKPSSNKNFMTVTMHTDRLS